MSKSILSGEMEEMMNNPNMPKNIEEQLMQSHKIYTSQYVQLEIENKALKEENEKLKNSIREFTVYTTRHCSNPRALYLEKLLSDCNRAEAQLKIADTKLRKLKARILCENADELLEYLMDIIDGKIKTCKDCKMYFSDYGNLHDWCRLSLECKEIKDIDKICEKFIEVEYV